MPKTCRHLLHHKHLGRLAIHAGEVREGGAIPYLLCEDIKQTCTEFKKRGIQIEAPQRDGESPWFTQFVDCVGNQGGLEER